MLKKVIGLFLLFAWLILMGGCTGIEFVNFDQPVPKVHLKHRFYANNYIDTHGNKRIVTDTFRRILVQQYPEYFTADPKAGIHVRMRELCTTQESVVGGEVILVPFAIYSLFTIPLCTTSENTVYYAYEVLSPTPPLETFDQRVIQTSHGHVEKHIEVHIGWNFLALLGFWNCHITPFTSPEEDLQLLQEYEAKMLAIALLSDPMAVYLANLDYDVLATIGVLPPPAQTSQPLKRVQSQSQQAKTPVHTPQPLPVAQPMPSLPTQNYRVVFDNFNNETGKGEYAVVFTTPATFADTRAVRNTVFEYAKELFCSIRANVEIEEVDVVAWQGGFDRAKGENYYAFTMSLAAVQPFDLAYDNKTRKGYLKVRIDGSDIQATMIWAQRNIEALVNRYNRTLSSSETEIPEGGSYLFEREETTSDGYYIFHFKVVD